MAEFHETKYGRNFFENQLPELIKSLNKSAEAARRNNELTEESIKAINSQTNIVKEIQNGTRDISIETPKGKLKVIFGTDPNYPGIYILLEKNGERNESETIALVEHDPTKGIRTIAWNKKNGEDFASETIWDQKD